MDVEVGVEVGARVARATGTPRTEVPVDRRVVCRRAPLPVRTRLATPSNTVGPTPSQEEAPGGLAISSPTAAAAALGAEEGGRVPTTGPGAAEAGQAGAISRRGRHRSIAGINQSRISSCLRSSFPPRRCGALREDPAPPLCTTSPGALEGCTNRRDTTEEEQERLTLTSRCSHRT